MGLRKAREGYTEKEKVNNQEGRCLSRYNRVKSIAKIKSKADLGH